MNQKVILYLIKILKQFIEFIEKKYFYKDSNEQALTSLAPKVIFDKDELKKLNPYLDNLKKAINTEGINNIALTGSYGSGKSTILKTFQHHNVQYKYLNISLASFKDNKEDKDEFERKLEVSILQQIFYHVEPFKIPDSRFKRIVNITTSKLILHTLFVVSWVVSVIILFKFDYINKLNPLSWKLGLKIDWLAVIPIVIFLTGIGLFVKTIVRLFSNSKINKFNIKGEVELGESNDKSVFNQHLEEILYFFERTSFNVVIIEDVDRFNSTDIFTKLREINILINNSNLIKRKVSFVYAIKDEMFKDSNERVKFFEYIVPVIPFVNPSNAGEQLAKLIQSAGLQTDLSIEFINDVTTFINDIDMRLLINIFQEFLIYKENLTSVINYNELFAIIIYKNLYPEDFGGLSKGRGKLYDFFYKKPVYTELLISDLNDKIQKLEIENSNIENEKISSITELRQVYISEIIANIPNVSTINGIEIKSLIEDENFNALLNNKDNIKYQSFVLSIHYSGRYEVRNGELGKNFAQIEKQVNSQYRYLERANYINGKLKNKIDLNKTEIIKLKKQIIGIQLLNVKEIFERVNIDVYLNDFKENYLIRNLLLNGYINENYNDYISIFHEVNLTKSDFEFERKVKSGIILPFEFELTKTENVIKRLALKYFSKEAILNYKLLDELINLQYKYLDKYDSFFEYLNHDTEKIYQFIIGYLERKESYTSKFLKQLIYTKENFLEYLFNKSKLPQGKIRELIILIFEYATSDSIKNQLEINLLVDWFSQTSDFCEYSTKFKDTKKLYTFFKDLNVVISQLDLPNEQSNDTFRFIVTNKLYLITADNLLIILKWHNSSVLENEFYTSNYTFIKNTMPTHVLEYVEENISAYVNNVLLKLVENKNESEESIIEILNNEELSIEVKTDFIKMQNQTISSISLIENVEDMELLMRSNKIQPSWNNIFEYYDCLGDNAEIDEIMIDYFNYEFNFKNLSTKKLSIVKEKNEEYIKAFSQRLIYCDQLSLEAYTNLLKSVPYRYNSLQFDKLSLQKIEWMIDNTFITLNQLIFEKIKEIDTQLAVRLLGVYSQEFIEKSTEFTLDNNDWLVLFKSEYFDPESKVVLIEKLDNEIIIQNESIANIVCNLLPNDRFIPFEYEALKAMFKYNSSIQKRIELLDLYFDKLEDDQLQSLIEELGDDYARMFVKQKKPILGNTPYNARLVNRLKEKGMISSYSVNQEKNEIKVVAKYTEE